MRGGGEVESIGMGRHVEEGGMEGTCDPVSRVVAFKKICRGMRGVTERTGWRSEGE